MKALLCFLFVACTKPNPDVCCTTAAECSAIGTQELRPCAAGLVCEDNSCVHPHDANISPEGTSDGGIHVFDVAYPDEWRFSVSGPVSGYFMIINTSGSDISSTTLELKSIDDDHPTAIVRVAASPFTTLITPGHAGGYLTPLSRALLVDSGTVPEPRTDTSSDYLNVEIQNAPPGAYDIHANVALALDNIRIPIALTIHIVPGPSVYADPLHAKRMMVFR